MYILGNERTNARPPTERKKEISGSIITRGRIQDGSATFVEFVSSGLQVIDEAGFVDVDEDVVITDCGVAVR